MMPRTAIAQIANMIGRELECGSGPSEEAVAAGPLLAEAGATAEIVGWLLAEAHRKRPDDRMIAASAFMLEGALGTLRLQASGGDVGADHAIAEVRNRLDDALQRGGVAPEVLMLVVRAFARAELDPGRTLQEAMMSAMEAQAPSMPAAEISDHFAELAATLHNDPFEIYAELATTAAAFPAEHHAAMADALAMSDSEAVREAALGFAFSPDPAVSSAALIAVSQQGRGPLVSSKVVDRLCGCGLGFRRRASQMSTLPSPRCGRGLHRLYRLSGGKSAASWLHYATARGHKACWRSPSEGDALRWPPCW
jgi:hypothetical protein